MVDSASTTQTPKDVIVHLADRPELLEQFKLIKIKELYAWLGGTEKLGRFNT